MANEILIDGFQQAKKNIRNHPVYWFEDGSLEFEVEIQQFKVHRTLLSRHSRFFSNLPKTWNMDNQSILAGSMSPDSHHVILEPTQLVKAEDVEVLLQHLYHDVLFSRDSTLDRIASILRVTSPRQLDFPQIHESAREIFLGMFPCDPVTFTHTHPLHEAIPIVKDFHLTSVWKAILYSLVTTTEFDVSGQEEGSLQDPQTNSTAALPHIVLDSRHVGSVIDQGITEPVVGASTAIYIPSLVDHNSEEQRQSSVLSPEDSKICMMLMTRIIEHFTPTLFTPPPTSHMECTDALADTWMTLVIQPAIEDDGVYKPLETLKRMKAIDWEEHGLCAPCVEEKRREWTDEQRLIWRLMDVWLKRPEDEQFVLSG
ncbi:hypothetical protein CPB83DRAFT_607900 [Crepidotus variabilis]|uniref:BTB domain-containing protein n=1 Tax=Crepidotus variabilis TaxID=179855 RepID=A0A9P6E8H3_9AGAR|nr:hypothetical protein CPB83DRAFT_607900 [Crepidotus variabilis]